MRSRTSQTQHPPFRQHPAAADEALRQLAERQHGLVLRPQAYAVGLSYREVRYRIERGDLVEVSMGLLRLAGAPQTDHQRALAAVYDAGLGGCLSHDSAAALWGFPGFRLDPIHVWRVRGHATRPNRFGTQHVTRMLPPDHVVGVEGIPTTSPTRLIFDQAARLPLGRVARLLDHAWAERLTSWRQLDRMLRSLSRRGRAGMRTVRLLLAERGPEYVPPESGLERRFHRLLADNGFAEYRRQVNLGDEDWIGRVDFLHPVYPLVVEIQSDRFHTSHTDRMADELRIASLRRAGFVVLVLTEFSVWHEPDQVLERLASAEREAKAASAVGLGAFSAA